MDIWVVRLGFRGPILVSKLIDGCDTPLRQLCLGTVSGEQWAINLYADPSSGEPSITFADRKGFMMSLGSTGTIAKVTGETQQTSAASIVMLGNDKSHHVIWQAP